MSEYIARFSVGYSRMGDSRCDPVQRYSSIQYFSSETIEAALEVARRFQQKLKDSFTYSVTLDSLEEKVFQ